MFDVRFFHESPSPSALIRGNIQVKKLITGVKKTINLPPMSMTPAINSSPVSPTPVVNLLPGSTTPVMKKWKQLQVASPFKDNKSKTELYVCSQSKRIQTKR
jgi:hypothetical protein